MRRSLVALQRHFLAFIEPKLFELMPSVLILIMVILGGHGELEGFRFGGFPFDSAARSSSLPWPSTFYSGRGPADDLWPGPYFSYVLTSSRFTWGI